MAQLQSLSERVRALEQKIPTLEEADAALGDKDSALLERITRLEQTTNSLVLSRIEYTQNLILKELATRHNAVALLFTCVTLNPTRVWGKGTKQMQLKANQESVASLSAVDSEGHPAPLNFDAPPTWVSSDSSIVTVVVSPDGMTAVIGSPNPGPLSSAVVTLSAMAAGKSLEATLAVDIIPGDAVAIQITTAAPTDV